MKKISLSQGKFALVDDEDYDYLMQWKWYAMKSRSGRIFYAVRGQYDPVTKKEKTIRMHQVIMKVKKGEEIDHKDSSGLNNQKYNLRPCTSTQNHANSGLQKNSTSGFRGVHFNKRVRKWSSRIDHNYKHIFLGYYFTPEEAARAYDRKATELFGEFARPNFPRRVARRKVA